MKIIKKEHLGFGTTMTMTEYKVTKEGRTKAYIIGAILLIIGVFIQLLGGMSMQFHGEQFKLGYDALVSVLAFLIIGEGVFFFCSVYMPDLSWIQVKLMSYMIGILLVTILIPFGRQPISNIVLGLACAGVLALIFGTNKYIYEMIREW